MAYNEISPHPLLREIIDTYWFVENKESQSYTIHILPDGCTDIVFDLSGLSIIPVIVGCMTTSDQVVVLPDQRILGIRFKPGCASSFIKTPLHELVDKQLLLSNIMKQPFSKTIKDINTAFIKEFFLGIDQTLLPILTVSTQDKIVRHSIFKIITSHGRKKISVIAKDTGCTTRQMERRFLEKVGLTPKQFASIIRFQYAHQQMKKAGVKDLAAIALDCGYYDQAHFNRSFKTFTGVHPTHEIMSHFYNTK